MLNKLHAVNYYKDLDRVFFGIGASAENNKLRVPNVSGSNPPSFGLLQQTRDYKATVANPSFLYFFRN